MISRAVIPNLLAASEQAALVAAVAGAIVWLLRLDPPGIRYVFWRSVAVVCLLLPWVQRYRPVPLPRGVVDDTAIQAVIASAAGSTTPASFNLVTVVIAVLVGGAVIRLTWLGFGLARLRDLRRHSMPAADTEMFEELQRTLGTRADIRYAARLPQPATFGLKRPVVLLPDALRRQPADIQRAVVGHELLHVHRRDWAWLIVEELALSVFWFHPAAWWVASRIQLAREELVDELTILLTGRRKAYVEALLAFSDYTSVVPTAAFARRRHLLRRIALISKEDSMTSRRIVASCAILALALCIGAWSAVAAFPLHAALDQATSLSTGPGPLERRARRVTPENPVPRRIHHEPPVMPDVSGVEGATVALKVTLDEVGRVAEARAVEVLVKGPELYVKAAGDDLRAQLDRLLGGMPAATREAARPAVEAFVRAALASARAWRYDPPAEAPLAFGLTIRFGDAPEDMTFSPAPGTAANALRVGGAIKAPQRTKYVAPEYPQAAKEARVEGVVILEVRIGTDGGVEEARVLRSIPLLDEAALDAVKQWKFEPTLLNGQPTPIIMTLTINFTLA